MKKIFLALVVIIGYFLALGKFVSFYTSDIYNTYSKNFLNNGEFEKALLYATESLKRNSQEPAYHRNKAKVLLATLVLEEEFESRAILKEEIEFYLKKAEELNPKNLTTLRNVIPLYYFLTIGDISLPATEDNIDQTYLPVTVMYYEKLKETYPNDLGVFTDAAKYEKELFLIDAYENSVERVIQLRPEILEWQESFK